MHALTTFQGSDDGVPTDLVQLDIDAAAIALRPDGKLVILLLHDTQRMRFEDLDNRLHHVLRSERREVIAGLQPGRVDVVLVHAPAHVINYPTVPRRSKTLERTIDWHAITPDGKIVGPSPQLGNMLAYAVRETQRLLPAGPKVDLAHVERRGEDRVGEVGKQRLFNRFAASLFKRAPATLALGAILIVLFILQLVWNATESLSALNRMGSMIPSKVEDGEVWRLLTAGYLHGGVMHIAGNLEALIACYFAELLLHRYRFIVLFTLAVIGGNVLALLFSDPNLPHVGASGGIFGIAAAFFWITIKDRRLLPRGAAWKLTLGFGLVLGFNILASFGPGVSMTGHLGGLITGTLLVLTGALTWGLPRKWMYEDEPPHVARVYKIAALVCIVLTVAGLAIAWGTGKPWAADRPTETHRVAFAPTPVSLDVPVEVSAPRTDGGDVVAGKPGDPLVIGVKVTDIAAPVAEVDVAAKIDTLRARLEAPRTGAMRWLGTPSVVTVAGRPGLFVMEQLTTDDGVHLDGPHWWMIYDAALVELEVLVAPGGGATAAWAQAARAIGDTIRWDATLATKPPPPTWRATAEVTNATGATSVTTGARCEVTMTRYPGKLQCRWRVTCDGAIVYGDFQSGWITCSDAIAADDRRMSSEDGDPALVVDATTLSVKDDAPEFVIEAKLNR